MYENHFSIIVLLLIREVLGTWKHSGLSAETLRLRNLRSRSPLVTRELDRWDLSVVSNGLVTLPFRYFEMTPNYVGDRSSGSSGFRHYNYRRVPYFGGSDDYSSVEMIFSN